MKNKEWNVAPVRMEREKYRAIRHAAIDLDITFNALMNKLIDEHLKQIHQTAISRPRTRSRGHGDVAVV